MEEFSKLITQNFGNIAVLFTAFIAIIYGTKDFFSKKQIRTEYLKSFEHTVNQLSSSDAETQLSAAVLLRRFLHIKLNWIFFRKRFLYNETINVVSSVLRTLPTSVYQKTLGDTLAYADRRKGLSHQDLQKTNLQDIYLGNKSYRIPCRKTDFFKADLSKALIENVDAEGAIFYDAILINARIKNSDFSNANFMGADLSNIRFVDVELNGARFDNAINIPEEIKAKLVDGIYKDTNKVTTAIKERGKTIFFSMPGVMTKEESAITSFYKDKLEEEYEVLYYGKDTYPKFGQLSNVRKSILRSSGVIAFGFKQTQIFEGVYRPSTKEEKLLNNEWISTPWNDIEVGMAYMLGIPILLVHDDEINTGVFDNMLSEYFIGRISSDNDIKTIDTNLVFQSWIRDVKEYVRKEELCKTNESGNWE